MSSERLLIVEDDNEIGDILDKYLKGYRFRITSFSLYDGMVLNALK